MIACDHKGNRRRLLLQLLEHNVNEDAIIAFLERLHQQIRGRVIVIWDGLPAHRGKKTQQYVRAQSHWLMSERFPAYAPEFNPVEYLWSSLKGKDVPNLCCDDLKELHEEVTAGADTIREDDELLYGYLRASTLF